MREQEMPERLPREREEVRNERRRRPSCRNPQRTFRKKFGAHEMLAGLRTRFEKRQQRNRGEKQRADSRRDGVSDRFCSMRMPQQFVRAVNSAEEGDVKQRLRMSGQNFEREHR